jgi:3-phytase
MKRLLPLALLIGCAIEDAAPVDAPIVVGEAFVTGAAPLSNLDSPAVWHAPDGAAWIITTGKSSHRLHVHDARSGELLGRVGGRGSGPGEFHRPNGIAVAGDLVLVVERDNARVQMLSLPAFESIGAFGAGSLRRPYGIAVLPRSATVLDVFVTDNYAGAAGGLPPDRELGQRVHHYRLDTGAGPVAARHVRAFGDTAGAGRLFDVESLAVDPDAGLLLIADELAGDVKVYRADGTFTGRVLWGDVIRHEPEGIVLYRCGAEGGYWILADQHRTMNRFLVFERRSFALAGAFAGMRVRNTDGLALTQQPVGAMAAGVLYAVDSDRAVGAFPWSDVAAALGLRDDCA